MGQLQGQCWLSPPKSLAHICPSHQRGGSCVKMYLTHLGPSARPGMEEAFKVTGRNCLGLKDSPCLFNFLSGGQR